MSKNDKTETENVGLEGYRPVNEGYRPARREQAGYQPPKNENQSTPEGTPPKKP